VGKENLDEWEASPCPGGDLLIFSNPFFFQGRPFFWGDSFFPHFVQVWWLFHFFSPLGVLVSALRFASLFSVCGCTSHVLLTIPSYYYDAG